MARYINADALKKSIREETLFLEWQNVLIGKVIDDQPTVDAVPIVHGRFEYGEDESGYDGYYCSKCFGHVRWYGKASEQSITFIEKYNYCPFCGARMDE